MFWRPVEFHCDFLCLFAAFRSTVKVKHCTLNQNASIQGYKVPGIQGYQDTNMGTVAGRPEARGYYLSLGSARH